MTPDRLAFFREHIARASNVTPAQAAELLAALDAQAEVNARLVHWLKEARDLADSKFGGTNMDFWTIAAAGLAEAGIDSLPAALNPTQRNQEETKL